MTATPRAVPAAVLRLHELDRLVHDQLAHAIQVVKLAYELAEGSVYEDNKNDFESEALHRINELTRQSVPASQRWEFKHVSIIADAKPITQALAKMSAKAHPAAAAAPAHDKTTVCIHHKRGACNKAGKCEYAHSKRELAAHCRSQWDKYKTELCKKWPKCEHGKTCLYAHGERELRTPAAAASDALSAGWRAFAHVFIDIYVGEYNTWCVDRMWDAQHDVQHAATDLRAAVRTLHYFRNVISRMSGTVQTKTCITVEAYDFMCQAIADAGSCLAAALVEEAGAAFENSTPARLSQRSVIRATAPAFTPGYTARGESRLHGYLAAPALTPPAPAVRVSTISGWTDEQVRDLFASLNFPTAGIVENFIDGDSLGLMCADINAEETFCAAVPDGLGFTKLLFKGRFKKEMALLNVAFYKPQTPAILPNRT